RHRRREPERGDRAIGRHPGDSLLRRLRVPGPAARVDGEAERLDTVRALRELLHGAVAQDTDRARGVEREPDRPVGRRRDADRDVRGVELDLVKSRRASVACAPREQAGADHDDHGERDIDPAQGTATHGDTVGGTGWCARTKRRTPATPAQMTMASTPRPPASQLNAMRLDAAFSLIARIASRSRERTANPA